MRLLSFLREADYLISIAVDSAILCFAFAAYRRCRMKAFAFLIWGSMIGITITAGMHIHRAAPATPVNEDLTFWQLYRVGYIAATVLCGTGIILLIRYVMTLVGQGAGSNPTLQPTAAASSASSVTCNPNTQPPATPPSGGCG